MRRVGRIIFGGAAAVSAGVALLVAVAWGVGEWRTVVIHGESPRIGGVLYVQQGGLELFATRYASPRTFWDGYVQNWPFPMPPDSTFWARRQTLTWDCGRAAWGRSRGTYIGEQAAVTEYLVILPYWPILAASLALPGACVGRWMIARRRRARGGRGFQVEGLRAED